MSQNDREQRRIIRQRGAGTRGLQNANFSFSLGGNPGPPPISASTEAQIKSPTASSSSSKPASSLKIGNGRISPSPSRTPAQSPSPVSTAHSRSSYFRSNSASPTGLRKSLQSAGTPAGPRQSGSAHSSPISSSVRRSSRPSSSIYRSTIGSGPMSLLDENSVHNFATSTKRDDESKRESSQAPARAAFSISPPTRQHTYNSSSTFRDAPIHTPPSTTLRVMVPQSSSPTPTATLPTLPIRTTSTRTHVSDSQSSDDSPGEISTASNNLEVINEDESGQRSEDDTILRNSSASPMKTSRLFEPSELEAGPSLTPTPTQASSGSPLPPQPCPVFSLPSLQARPLKRRTVSLPVPVLRRSKRLKSRQTEPSVPTMSAEETPEDEDGSDQVRGLGGNDDEDEDSSAALGVAIASYRVYTKLEDFEGKKPVMPVEVLAQVTSDISSHYISKLRNNRERGGSMASRLRELSYVQAFDLTLQASFFELAEAQLAGDILEKRLRSARAQLAHRRREILSLREKTADLELEMDSIRAAYSARAGRVHEQREIASSWEDVVLSFATAHASTPSPSELSKNEKAKARANAGGDVSAGVDGVAVDADIVERVQKVSRQVSGRSTGLLARLRSFNQLLEGTLLTLERQLTGTEE